MTRASQDQSKKYKERVHEGKKTFMSQELFHIRWGFMKGITLERSHTGALSVARSSQRDLKKYQRIHEGNNHWSAPNVTGAFSHEVKIHEGNHTGEKPFNWTKCGKNFSESGDLKDYQRKRRIHEKKKPLQCTKYYRSFYKSNELTWRESHWREAIQLHKVWQELLRIKILKVPSEGPWRKETIAD